MLFDHCINPSSLCFFIASNTKSQRKNKPTIPSATNACLEFLVVDSFCYLISGYTFMDQNVKQCTCETGFDFAFDNPLFSDQTLRLIILEDSPVNEENKSESSKPIDENTVSPQQMRKHFTKLDEEGCQDICIGSTRVKTLHISSVILAAKSSFFLKLFTSTNTGEPEKRDVVLQIHSSEEVTLIDVLKFMYSKKLLSAKSPIALMKVLMTADRFSVPSCVSYCCELLQSHPLSLELASSFIDLPTSLISSYKAVQELVDASKSFIFSNLPDVSKYHEHMMNLSIDGVKTFLSSDDLKVDSEDAAYDLFVEWLEKQYSTDPEQRHKVYNSELCNLIRLQLMTPQKWKSISSTDNNNIVSLLDPTLATSIIDAILSSKNDASLSRRRRAYKSPPVSVIGFEVPVRQCVAYLDLTRKECESLGSLNSQTFMFGGHAFYLDIKRYTSQPAGTTSLAMYLHLKDRKQSLDAEYEFSARTKTRPRGFVRQNDEITYTFKMGEETGYGYHNLFKESWESVMAKDSQFFVNDIMHLKVAITLA